MVENVTQKIKSGTNFYTALAISNMISTNRFMCIKQRLTEVIVSQKILTVTRTSAINVPNLQKLPLAKRTAHLKKRLLNVLVQLKIEEV